MTPSYQLIRATILTGQGGDRVSVQTDLPGTMWPYTEPLYFNFEVAIGKGVEYVRKHFPELVYEVVER